MAKNDFMLNGQQSAFPTIGEHSHMLEGGLTKREYFAAMADIPWDVAYDTLKKKQFSEKEITVKQLIEYRVSMQILSADELLKQLES